MVGVALYPEGVGLLLQGSGRDGGTSCGGRARPHAQRGHTTEKGRRSKKQVAHSLSSEVQVRGMQ